MKQTSNYTFARIPQAQIPRSSFRRDRTYKSAFDSGKLIPFFIDEALPGDTFNVKLTSFARLATPIVPFMDNLSMDFHFFAVPNRLVWDNWVKMMGEQTNPGDSTDYLVPTIQAPENGWSVGSQMDYLGIPTGVPYLEVSSLPFRAINLIYNEWFRDENLQDSLPIERGDTDSDSAIATYASLKPRGKRHDYFTSALPWPQKGPSIPFPASGTAPVTGTPVYSLASIPPSSTNKAEMYYAGGSISTFRTIGVSPAITVPSGESAKLGISDGLFADLSSATFGTINSIREAIQLQRLYERDARGGTRYTEILQSHFGVVSPDARLQRPEYLGGGTTPINIHSVAQTSATDETTPQGNLAAYGVSGQSGIGFSKSFTEHTIIVGFVSVRADLTYQQGLDRMWSRRSRFDFYWPALAHLGEQVIKNKEIFAQGTSVDDEAFGYQERWAEYRYGISKITGKLRSTDPHSLDCWHLSQKFDALPTLGPDFIVENVPLARVLAVQDEPQLIFDSLIACNCVRPMPLYSVPGLMDHF